MPGPLPVVPNSESSVGTNDRLCKEKVYSLEWFHSTFIVLSIFLPPFHHCIVFEGLFKSPTACKGLMDGGGIAFLPTSCFRSDRGVYWIPFCGKIIICRRIERWLSWSIATEPRSGLLSHPTWKGEVESNAGKGSECHKKIVPWCKDPSKRELYLRSILLWGVQIKFCIRHNCH